jgi:hypothetical protein
MKQQQRSEDLAPVLSPSIPEHRALRRAAEILRNEAALFMIQGRETLAVADMLDKAVEVRLNADGSLDEVCAVNFHLEQMSATHWWMAIDDDRGSVHVNLHSRATIHANVNDERDVSVRPQDNAEAK